MSIDYRYGSRQAPEDPFSDAYATTPNIWTLSTSDLTSPSNCSGFVKLLHNRERRRVPLRHRPCLQPNPSLTARRAASIISCSGRSIIQTQLLHYPGVDFISILCKLTKLK